MSHMGFCLIFISYDVVEQYKMIKNAVIFTKFPHDSKCDNDFTQQFNKQEVNAVITVIKNE